MMSNVEELLESLTPQMYRQLKQAVELGRWPTGGHLTKEQRELCMQAVIGYEKKHFPPEEQTGYIPPKKHTHCGSEKGQVAEDPVANDQEQPLTFKN